jgi:hypothetical protein
MEFSSVPKVLAAYIFKRLHYLPDDGDSKHPWNVGKLPADYGEQQPRTQPSSHSPPAEPEILDEKHKDVRTHEHSLCIKRK